MSAAPQRKQARSEGERTGPLIELMRAMGSTKGFDPIPPDQYLTYLDERYSPEQRLEAWMRSKTMRNGHRSPYAADEHGNELYLKHAAAELKMDPGNVGRAWRNLEAEGRVRMEGRRLYLCGSVQLPEAKKKRSVVCTDNYPPYIARQLKDLPPERRKPFLAAEQADRNRIAKLMAESAAGWRAIFDQRQDSRFAEYGIKKIRKSKRREAEPAFVPLFREFLEKACTDNPSPFVLVCNRPKNGHVQTSASLLTSEIEEERGSAAAALSVTGNAGGTEQDAAADWGESFEKLGHTDPTPSKKVETPIAETAAAVRRYYWSEGDAFVWGLVAKCRELVPGATDWQIAASVKSAWRKHRKEQRKAGLFLATVPEFLAEFVKMPEEGQRQLSADCDALDRREGLI